MRLMRRVEKEIEMYKLHANMALALALASCNSGPKIVSMDSAMRSVAKCMGWPESVIKTGHVTTEVIPKDKPAPYLHFPNARSVTVSPSGQCAALVPADLLSNVPVHDLKVHWKVVSPDMRHVWLIKLMADVQGIRTFAAADGSPAENLPFEMPDLNTDPVSNELYKPTDYT